MKNLSRKLIALLLAVCLFAGVMPMVSAYDLKVAPINLQTRGLVDVSGGTDNQVCKLFYQASTTMIDDLAAFGSPVLLFSGGEPCLRPDLVELMSYARRAGMRVVLSTNGTLITPERARAVMDRLRLSGCPNSCNDHEQAAIGLQGMRKRVDGELVDGFTVWRKDGAAHIGAEDPEFIPAADLPARIVPLLTEAGIL